jgi:hypothetical protein
VGNAIPLPTHIGWKDFLCPVVGRKKENVNAVARKRSEGF